MQCFLLVGLGINEGAGEDQDGGESEEDEDVEFSEFDPDELPGLVDAIKILFFGSTTLFHAERKCRGRLRARDAGQTSKGDLSAFFSTHT